MHSDLSLHIWGVNFWGENVMMCKRFLIILVNFSTKGHFFPMIWFHIVREWPWQEEEKAAIDRGTSGVRAEQASGEEKPRLMVGRLWPWHRPSAPSPPPEAPPVAGWVAHSGLAPHTSPIHPHSQGRALNHPDCSGSGRAMPWRHGTLWLRHIYHPP